MKSQTYLFMNDSDRRLFAEYCKSLGLTMHDEYLVADDKDETQPDGFDSELPAYRIDTFYSRQYGKLLTIGRISLPKNASRDKSASMKSIRSAYKNLTVWIAEKFDSHLVEILRDGSEHVCDMHWIGPATRRAVEKGELQLCFATNGNRFVLRNR